jgi:hypothetical protein
MALQRLLITLITTTTTLQLLYPDFRDLEGLAFLRGREARQLLGITLRVLLEAVMETAVLAVEHLVLVTKRAAQVLAAS